MFIGENSDKSKIFTQYPIHQSEKTPMLLDISGFIVFLLTINSETKLNHVINTFWYSALLS